MENECPVTPPPELVEQWLAEPEYVSGWNGECMMLSVTDHRLSNICAKAAQWGADQELEATLGLMATLNIRGVDYVRNARRSARAPSLKEEALKQLQFLQQCGAGHRDTDKILRALEQLSD